MQKRNLSVSQAKGVLILALSVLMGVLCVGTLVGPKVEAQIDDGGEGEERRPTPRPTITATSTSTPIPTSTWTPVPPTPSPTPVPKCLWVAAWNQCSGIWQTFGCSSYLTTQRDSYRYDKNVNVPSCFASRWAASCPLQQYSGAFQYFSMCTNAGTIVGSKDLGAFLGVPTGFGYSTVANDWLMDENCRYVSSKGSNQICGFAGIATSPISLIFDNDTNVNDGMTVVPFSLSRNTSASFSLWKASAKAPLLVYDPEHRGEVTSSTQLFGNYTFGGKRLSLIHASLSNDSQSIPAWENGYEALALLDSNNDGRVSGKELESLSLWFDGDRDGRADQGEVRSVKEEGIVSVYFKGYKPVAGSKDIALEVGYERMLNGKIVGGKSVDWFGETFASREEALQALPAIFTQKLVQSASASDQVAALMSDKDWKANPLAFKPPVIDKHESDVSGYWLWSVDEKGGTNHPGVFAFAQKENQVIGFSVAETQLEKNDSDIKSGVKASPAEGTLRKNAEGNMELAMLVKDPNGEGQAETNAVLSENGTLLIGTTKQNYRMVTKEGERESASVTYTWHARKFMDKPNK